MIKIGERISVDKSALEQVVEFFNKVTNLECLKPEVIDCISVLEHNIEQYYWEQENISEQECALDAAIAHYHELEKEDNEVLKLLKEISSKLDEQQR